MERIATDQDFQNLADRAHNQGSLVSEAEKERRQQAAQRLKERYSYLPFYKNFTEQDWVRFHSSQINSNG